MQDARSVRVSCAIAANTRPFLTSGGGFIESLKGPFTLINCRPPSRFEGGSIGVATSVVAVVLYALLMKVAALLRLAQNRSLDER